MKRLHVNDNYVKSLQVSLAIQKITKEYTENHPKDGVKRIEQKRTKPKGNTISQIHKKKKHKNLIANERTMILRYVNNLLAEEITP